MRHLNIFNDFLFKVALRFAFYTEMDKMCSMIRDLSFRERMVRDITGSAAHIPPDFDETLETLTEQYLTDDEARVINLYYMKGLTLRESAHEMGIDVATDGVRRDSALGKLRKHTDILLTGQRYAGRYQEMREAYDEAADEIRWMDAAIQYLREVRDESDENIETDSKEAKDFYRRKGLRKLSDVYGTTPQELVAELTAYAERQAALPDDIEDEEELTDMDFTEAELSAFDDAGLITVEDAISLTPEEAATLPREGRSGIIRLYRMIAGIADHRQEDTDE